MNISLYEKPQKKCDGRTHKHTDGQTDRRKDKQRHNNIPPPRRQMKKESITSPSSQFWLNKNDIKRNSSVFENMIKKTQKNRLLPWKPNILIHFFLESKKYVLKYSISF